MTPFKRSGRKAYEGEPKIPGMGAFPRLFYGTRDKRVADLMENALRQLAMTGWRDLVEQVRTKQLNVQELWQAKLAGDVALEKLRSRVKYPPLSDVIEAYKKRAREREAYGADHLLELAPEVEKERATDEHRTPDTELRLSWLTDPRNISLLYAKARGAGQSASTVRRGLHRAVAEILKEQLGGRGKMLAVMADVDMPSGKDERTVMLWPDEIKEMVRLAAEDFRPAVGVSLATGVDRGPLLTGSVRDYEAKSGAWQVHDTKAPGRQRILTLRGEPILGNAEYWLKHMVESRNPADPLVDMSLSTFRRRWDDLRQKIQRPDVRWKDLRGVFATYYLLAGGSPRDLQEILGHESPTMTMRYLRRTAMLRKNEELRAYAPRMGLPADPLIMVSTGRAG